MPSKKSGQTFCVLKGLSFCWEAERKIVCVVIKSLDKRSVQNEVNFEELDVWFLGGSGPATFRVSKSCFEMDLCRFQFL